MLAHHATGLLPMRAAPERRVAVASLLARRRGQMRGERDEYRGGGGGGREEEEDEGENNMWGPRGLIIFKLFFLN